MIRIYKKDVPKELVEYEKSENASYEGFTQKEAIKHSLMEEQFGLCAYCMGRINDENMKIEHFKCQSNFPESQLDYHNMLGCCKGNEGMPYKQQTCDTHKGDKPLSLNPSLESDFDKMQIYYSAEGKICSLNEEFDKEINEVLNLNTGLLKNNRKAMIDSVKKTLSKKSGDRTKSEIEKLIKKYESDHKPYCGAALYYLRKKLRSAK